MDRVARWGLFVYGARKPFHFHDAAQLLFWDIPSAFP